MSQLRVNDIVSENGTGSPSFSNGLSVDNVNVSGVATFSSNVEVDGNLQVAGTLTYEDVTSVDAVGIITAQAGVVVVGGGVSIANGGLNVAGGAVTFAAGPTIPNGQFYRATNNSGDAKIVGGYIAGSDTARIGEFIYESSGKVGLNITNPSDYDSSGNELVVGKTGNNGGMTIVSGTSNNGHIFFADGTGSNASARGIIKYEHANNALAFNTDTVERMRVTSAGLVGIGTANPLSTLSVRTGTDAIINFTTMSGEAALETFNDAGLSNVTMRYRAADHKFFISNDEKVSINSAGNATFKSGLVEKADLGTTLQADNTLSLSDGNVVFKSSNETGGAQTVNFTGIHGVIDTAETVSFTVIITPNGAGSINAVQVDGAAISSLYWAGGSAPTASASGRDLYSFTIIKSGSATTDYEIFASMTNFA